MDFTFIPCSIFELSYRNLLKVSNNIYYTYKFTIITHGITITFYWITV